MPDATPARTVGENGVALWRCEGAFYTFAHRSADDVPESAEPYVAFPKDEAEALVKVARMACDPLRTDGLLTLALMDLDAARKQRGSDAPV